MQSRPWRRTLLVLLALLLVAGLTPAVPQLTARAAEPEPPADPAVAEPQAFGGRVLALPFVASPPAPPVVPPAMAVRLRSDPSQAIQPGAILTYEIRATNDGGSTGTTQVTLPYNRSQLEFVGSDTDSAAGDWIDRLDSFEVSLRFGRLSPGRSRVAYLYARVIAPLGSLIDMRGTYDCRAGRCITNGVAVRVASSPGSGGQFDLAVLPSSVVPRGQRLTFQTDRFWPGERVTTWLNTPTGIQELGLAANADSLGRVAFQLETVGFSSGSCFSFVAYGNSSLLTGVGPFCVQGSLVADDAAGPIVARVAELPPAAVEQPASTLPPSGTAGISGQVTAAEAVIPLENVLVQVIDVTDPGDPIVVAVRRTDVSGFYLLPTGLRADRSYSVRFITYGSLSSTTRQYVGKTIAVPPLVDGELREQVDAVLNIGATLEGRVTGEGSSVGLPGVAVLLYDDSGPTPRVVARGTTSSSGAFVVNAIPEGSYRIRFEPSQVLGRSIPYAPLELPVGTRSFSHGQRSTGLNVVLPLEPTTGQISGRALALDTGLGLADVPVLITTSTGEFADLVRTDAAGGFRSRELAPGTYDVDFLPLFSLDEDSKPYLSAEVTGVTVEAGEITANVEAELARGGQIAGSVGDPISRQPIPRVFVTVYDGDGEPVAIAFTGDDGTFTTPGLPSGSYRLRFQPALANEELGTAYAEEYYNNATSLAEATAVPVTVDSTATLAPVLLVQQP